MKKEPRSIEQQQELIRKAVANGYETYAQTIEEKVGDYDKDEVGYILSGSTYESMWNAYVYTDTMVRDYVMEIIA